MELGLSRADLVAQPLYLDHGDVVAKRAEIKAYFNQTQATYEALFDTLACDAAFYARPCSLRHPLIFYFGHTATFFTNKLVLAKLLPARINPTIESLCAIGVDEMSWDDLNEAHYDWPSVEAVREYRQQVRAAVNDLIDRVEFTLPIDWQSPMWPIMMGIEHERIHLETSSVLIRQLPMDMVQPSALFPLCPNQGSAPENQLLPVSPGLVQLNKQDPASLYGWDNEYGQHQADVAGFNAAQYLVSNAEYLAFVDAGGYDKAQYWDDEGNRWRQFSALKHPSFWLQKINEAGHQAWWLRCMTEEVPMPWNWPVEVNFLEAAAFCRWKSEQTGLPIRLPSEDEYVRLYDVTQARTFSAQANWNLQQFASSTPVDQNGMNGFYDVVGNVWQWTQTPIYPFDGFKVHPLYDDFTTPTFDNKHNIFKGGSWISSGNEINGTSRYAFRRHFFQHAGFRYIESAAAVQTEFATYETDSDITQACENHYGQTSLDLPKFAQACAQAAINVMQQDKSFTGRNDLSVLDVGCSVGRSSFELAKHFAHVTGLDFSARFIQLANQLQQGNLVRYTLPIEGEIMDFKQASLAELDLDKTAHKCEFLQQDAANIKPRLTGYDMVFAADLLDRLYDPQAFLSQVHQRLNAGGLLWLASAYDWQAAVTPKQRWLGGYKDSKSGENVSSLEGLQQVLNTHFSLVNEPYDLPRVTRLNHRTFNYALAQVTVWKKR